MSSLGGKRYRAAATLVGVAATSASGLAFEIALTRVFAISQFYHFAFLTVSMALLGFGASGSALTVFPRIGAGGPRRWVWLAAAQSLVTLLAYLASNALPFDSFAISWDRTQLWYLAAYYLILAVPFFFGGLIIAVLLSGAGEPEATPSHLIYGASLAGSGLGCLIAVVSLDRLGGEGTIGLAAAIAMGGGLAFATVLPYRRAVVALLVMTGALGAVAIAVPGWLEMNLSPYKSLEQALRFPGATVTGTDWHRGTRIDLVTSDGIRSLPGLSFGYTGAAPVQDGVAFDGDELSAVPRRAPEDADYASQMLIGLPWMLRPGAETLILEPRGGLDVQVALAMGAASVVAVEPHGPVLDLTVASGYSVYDDPRVAVVVGEPRSFVERSDDTFAVVDVALTAPYRPVTSGAYSLAEDYSLTVEAFRSYFELLQPGGVLAVERWVQTPPSEETRLLATAGAALREVGANPADTLVMLRSYSNALLLVQPDGWTTADTAVVRSFAEMERFDIVAMPGMLPDEANRFNVVPDEQYSVLAAALITTDDPGPLYAESQFSIAPPTDDHPFFGHYFKWEQSAEVLENLGRTWQPFGGAGYLVLVAFLVLATASAGLLIVAPLAVRRRERSLAPAGLQWWTVGYFGVLGLSFLLVEIPLVQLFILLIGDATMAFAVVLFAVLVASGAGSMSSPRVSWPLGAIALTLVALLSPVLIRALTPLVLAAPLPARVATGIAAIAPLGFLMGIMFPRGIAHLERRAPDLVPWAWAINGSVSVISAVAAALLALSFGFSMVLTVGAAGYGLAAMLALKADRSPLRARERNEHNSSQVLSGH